MKARNPAMMTRRIVSRSFMTIMTVITVPSTIPSMARMARSGTLFASARSNRRSRRVCAGSGLHLPSMAGPALRS